MSEIRIRLQNNFDRTEEWVEQSPVRWQIHCLVTEQPPPPQLTPSRLLPLKPDCFPGQRALLACGPAYCPLLLHAHRAGSPEVIRIRSLQLTSIFWPLFSHFHWQSLNTEGVCLLYSFNTDLFFSLSPVMMEKMFILLPKVNPKGVLWIPSFLDSLWPSDFIYLPALAFFPYLQLPCLS